VLYENIARKVDTQIGVAHFELAVSYEHKMSMKWNTVAVFTQIYNLIGTVKL
jgi:hypothetical protein